MVPSMPSPPETRASLILRLPDAADVAAWDEFVALYGPLVYRLARRKGIQPADADDLVQEVFSSVAESVADWLDRTDRGPFRAWLFRIARNTAINFLTRPRHRPMSRGGETSQLDEFAADDDATDEFELEFKREAFRRAAEEVRERVSEQTWEAFWLTSVETQSIAEAADQLGMSVGAVYIARSRVMKKLRDQVARFAAEEWADE